jgi:hypothetical protein
LPDFRQLAQAFGQMAEPFRPGSRRLALQPRQGILQPQAFGFLALIEGQ